MKRSKAYRAAQDLIAPGVVYGPEDAARIAKMTASVGFDATIEAVIGLAGGAAQSRTAPVTVDLPHGTGRLPKVVVFASGENAALALAAGATRAGGADLVGEIEDGFREFDAAVAVPEMMSTVGRIASVLGPRGLMPDPRTGTVTRDPAAAVRAIASGRVAVRPDRHGTVHAAVGRASFTDAQIAENYLAVLAAMRDTAPAGTRNRAVRHASLSASMRPSVPVALA